ncbi:MAG: hypothetical protein HY658_04665 [Actinobacteria bacterium]|nr:hypothetical protein [Actinomycetota bacterium]
MPKPPHWTDAEYVDALKKVGQKAADQINRLQNLPEHLRNKPFVRNQLANWRNTLNAVRGSLIRQGATAAAAEVAGLEAGIGTVGAVELGATVPSATTGAVQAGSTVPLGEAGAAARPPSLMMRILSGVRSAGGAVVRGGATVLRTIGGAVVRGAPGGVAGVVGAVVVTVVIGGIVYVVQARGVDPGPDVQAAFSCEAAEPPEGFTRTVLADVSGVGEQVGEVYTSFLCNYGFTSTETGEMAGAAFTVEYACPDEVRQRFVDKTGQRENEVRRTDDEVLVRETGEFTSFTGAYSQQDRMWKITGDTSVTTLVVHSNGGVTADGLAEYAVALGAALQPPTAALGCG